MKSSVLCFFFFLILLYYNTSRIFGGLEHFCCKCFLSQFILNLKCDVLYVHEYIYAVLVCILIICLSEFIMVEFEKVIKKKKIIVCKVFSNTWKIWVIGKLKLPFWLKPKPKMVKIKQFGNVYKTQNFIVRKVQSCVGKHNSVFINNFFRFCNVVD